MWEVVSSQIASQMAAARLGPPTRWMARTPVGDRYVLECMREQGFNLGGEPSGHIILSDYTTTGDGLVAALQVLAVVQKLRRPVSEVCHRFDPLPQILKNVRYRSGKPLDDAEVKSAIVDGEKRLNGHGRLLVRSSGTEPVIRVMGEGDDRILVEEVVEGLKAGGYPLAAVVMPATVDDIRRVSLHNERMPAKSTYFYPKLLSGLVVNPLDSN